MKAGKENKIVVPTFFLFLITAFFEPWMQSSLNTISIIMVMFLTINIYAPYIFETVDEKNQTTLE
jgi:hypothetical protein